MTNTEVTTSRDKQENDQVPKTSRTEIAKPDPNFLYSTLATILVGPTEQRFHVHEALLYTNSPFFRAALHGNFIEKDGLIRLPNQCPSPFKYFIYWLYSGRLHGYFYPPTFSPSLKKLRSELQTEIVRQGESCQYDLPLDNIPRQLYNEAVYYDIPFSSLIALYILADALQIQGLKNPIINTLVEHYDFSVSSCDISEFDDMDVDPEHSLEEGISFFWSREAFNLGLESPCIGINMAWETLGRDSKLGKVLVELFCNNVAYVSDERFSDGKLSAGFVLEVAEAYARRWTQNGKGTRWDVEGVVCGFHEHESVEKCPLPALDMDREYVFAEWGEGEGQSKDGGSNNPVVVG